MFSGTEDTPSVQLWTESVFFPLGFLYTPRRPLLITNINRGGRWVYLICSQSYVSNCHGKSMKVSPKDRP